MKELNCTPVVCRLRSTGIVLAIKLYQKLDFVWFWVSVSYLLQPADNEHFWECSF